MKIVIGVLVIAVLIGLISFRGLHRRMQRLAESQTADEKARHEVLAPPISTPTDVTVNAKIFWAAGADKIAPVQVQLPLSADPVQRSWQLLHELTVNPPTPGQRTLPADTVLLGFYILPDGTAVADFSDMEIVEARVIFGTGRNRRAPKGHDLAMPMRSPARVTFASSSIARSAMRRFRSIPATVMPLPPSCMIASAAPG